MKKMEFFTSEIVYG